MMLFEKNCRPSIQLLPETGELLENFKNHSQLPTIYFIILFWFIFSSFQVPQSCYFIHSRFLWINRWVYLEKMSAIKSATTWNRGIPCNILKITYNHLLFIFYNYFLVHFLIISSSIDLIFDSLNIFMV